MISEMAGKYNQESYVAVVCEIQPEWLFLQRVTWYTEDAFAGLEKIIWEAFLPRLFFRNTKPLSPIVGNLSMKPINMAGLGLLNPVTSAKGEIPKLLAGKRRTDLVHDGGRGILQHQPPTDAQGRKA